MFSLIRPLLFKMEAEQAHDLAIKSLQWASQSEIALKALRGIYANQIKAKPVEIMGLSLSHPLGLAAGFDKQGIAGDALAALGFSFIEYGTVTPLPQSGNPKPRLFRVPEHHAIINRMGFNSIGLDTFVANIKKSRIAHVKGLNIGKNATTPIERANDDYVAGLRAIYAIADYISINISSPNTKNLRELQGSEQLDALLGLLSQTREALSDQTGRYTPMALKVAPDIDQQQIETICRALIKYKIDGLIATNTTIDRECINNHPLANETGGLSGRPLKDKSTRCIKQFSELLQGEVQIIGVGGIEDAASAKSKLDAGASAIQLYSSLIYRGPAVVKQTVNRL